MTPAARSLLAAAVVAVAAFLLYDATLLPGQDLGDTASFQATIGDTILTPRQGYPLYYATGTLFTGLNPKDPARLINFASAVFAALGCGLLALTVAWLSGFAMAGVLAGLLYAVSYTFWSQAIIAEVYALHAFMMGLCFVALLAWGRHPTLGRLAGFFAVYAIGFGNHLQMILLLPGFALFLLLLVPGGPLQMVRPKVALLAGGMAALGAAQYLWNFRTLLDTPGRDPGLVEQLRTFYFDVTKADWRATMVMGIPERTLADRFRMYWFDLHQQFGTIGIALAVLGVIWLFWPAGALGRQSRSARPRIAAALLVLLVANWFFAFTYNVGDTHVFYLPSHFMVALFAGLGAAGVLTLTDEGGRREAEGGRRTHAVAVGLASLFLVAYPGWRAYDTFPALDRSHDWQVKEFFDKLTAGLNGNNSVFATDMNWQLHNGLDYYARYTRPELAVIDTTDALLYFPLLVQSNRDIGRPVAVTNGAKPMLTSTYGALLPVERDPRIAAPSFSERIGRFPAGTPYVLTLLEPYSSDPVDGVDIDDALAHLTGGRLRLEGMPGGARLALGDVKNVPGSINRLRYPGGPRYSVIAGRVGEKPTAIASDDWPFRVTVMAGDVRADVRIECWLPADTIRRMGFGRVIVGRSPALTLDRGASFVALRDGGRAPAVEYGWAILAPQPRWIIPVGPGSPR